MCTIIVIIAYYWVPRLKPVIYNLLYRKYRHASLQLMARLPWKPPLIVLLFQNLHFTFIIELWVLSCIPLRHHAVQANCVNLNTLISFKLLLCKLKCHKSAAACTRSDIPRHALALSYSTGKLCKLKHTDKPVLVINLSIMHVETWSIQTNN